MSNYTHHPVSSLQVAWHAEASKYMTLVGFTVVFWDHICTFSDEVQFIWTAPKSFVKLLFLANRYITLACMAVAACLTSRLEHMSDAGCLVSVGLLGCFEMGSLASWDLLLLFRVQALWAGHRRIIVATSILYCVTYIGHAGVGLLSGIMLIPHIYFDHLTNSCMVDDRPRPLAVLWSFALFYETVLFTLTILRLIMDRKSDELENPLMKSLYCGQILYNVVIIGVRVFSLVVFAALPPSLFFMGVYFIWAIITALVTRMMLHLRIVASSDSQGAQATLFGETAFSTRIIWAPPQASAVSSSCSALSQNPRLVDDPENVDRKDGEEDAETGDGIEMQSYRAGCIPGNHNG